MEIPLTVEVLGRTLHLIVQLPFQEAIPLLDQVPNRNRLTYVSRPEEGDPIDLRADLELPCIDQELQGPTWHLELRYQSAVVLAHHHELNCAALGLLARLDEDLSRLFRLRGLLRRGTHELQHAMRAAGASLQAHSRALSSGPISFVD